MATQFDQGVVIPLTVVSDPFGLKPLTQGLLTVNTVPQKSFFINITGSLSNIVIFNEVSRPMSASLVVSSATGDPTNNILSHEVLSSATTSGNLTVLSANISISITSSFNLNDKIVLRLVGNHNSFTTNNIINPTSFDSDLSLNISSTPNPSDTNMVLEPYFEGRPFIGSSADVTSGNIFRNIPNPFLQDIDYNRGPIPVNNQALISGSAERGTVPESYYTALSQTNIRYKGSKNQSSDFNIYDPQAGTSSFGNPINIGTYGQTPSVSSLDTNIYEFEWGGGTTPEILDYGAVKLGRILQASSKDLVKTIDPSSGISSNILATSAGNSAITARDYRQNVSEGLKATNTMSIDLGGSTRYFWLTTQSFSDYTHILNGNNPVNTEISMYMYPNSTAGSNPILPNTTKILNTQWGVPSISNYALTSSNSNVYATVGNIGGADNLILFNKNINISKVTKDSNGFYNAGQSIKPHWQTIGDQIVADLQNGEKWFVTLYDEFEFPNGQGDYNSALSTGSLSPYNKGYNTPDSNGNYSDPLAYKGVHEIIGTFDNFGTTQFFILLKNGIPFPTKNIGGGTPGNSLGMLIWKAKSTDKGEFVLVQDSILGGVQAGAFTNKYVPNYITQNFEFITKKYGSNQTG